jgi:hypothetical protein
MSKRLLRADSPSPSSAAAAISDSRKIFCAHSTEQFFCAAFLFRVGEKHGEKKQGDARLRMSRPAIGSRIIKHEFQATYGNH